MSDTKILRKRLLFRSNHRGMKEIDLLLGRFADLNIDILNDEEIADLDELLNENDPDLYNWITNKVLPPVRYQHQLMKKLQLFKFNESQIF